jgi:hypothetical protein
LVTGFSDENGHIVLAVPDKEVPNGRKLIWKAESSTLNSDPSKKLRCNQLASNYL